MLSVATSGVLYPHPARHSRRQAQWKPRRVARARQIEAKSPWFSGLVGFPPSGSQPEEPKAPRSAGGTFLRAGGRCRHELLSSAPRTAGVTPGPYRQIGELRSTMAEPLIESDA